MSDSTSDTFTFSADSTISQHGIDVEKLNQVATEVQTQLKSGFGDYCEKGSRGDIRHLQMPNFFKLLEEVHILNTVLARLHVANERDREGAPDTMSSNNAVEARMGGKTKTLAAQMQAMQEQVENLISKNEELQQGLKAATADAKEARRQTEAFQQETEMQRKDIVRLEKKTKELERKVPAADGTQGDVALLRREVSSLRCDVEAWSTAVASAESTVTNLIQVQCDDDAKHTKAIKELRIDIRAELKGHDFRASRMGEYINYQSFHLSHLTANQVLVRNWDWDETEAAIAENLICPEPPKTVALFRNSLGHSTGVVLLTFLALDDAFFVLCKRDKHLTVEDVYYPHREADVPRGSTTILIDGFDNDWTFTAIKKFLFEQVEIARLDNGLLMNQTEHGWFRGQVLVELHNTREVMRAVYTLKGKVVNGMTLKVGVVRDAMCGSDDSDEEEDNDDEDDNEDDE